MKKKIFIVSALLNWNDTRVFYKEALAIKKYYDVDLCAVADFKKEVKDGINIIGIKRYKTRLLRPLNWIRIFFYIINSKCSLIHFHDPELIGIAIFFKIFFRKRIIFDIHEDYGKTILDRDWLKYNFFRKIVSKSYIFIEKISTKLFDGNIIVLEKWKDKYKNTVSVKNYPIIDEKEEILNYDKREDRIVYVGSLGSKRGIVEMLKSFELVSKQKENIIFDIFGGWDDEPEIKEESMKIINNNKNIILHGYKPLPETKNIIKKAKMGFCLYTMQQYEENIPVKMYEYISYGTPVVCTNFKSWEEDINKEGWGIPANPNDSEYVANAILKIIEDKNFKIFHENCIKYRKNYDWKNEEEKLLNLYTKLLT